jgi:ATP-dependent exoDNAse (exonuclease V) alpha subunit
MIAVEQRLGVAVEGLATSERGHGVADAREPRMLASAAGERGMTCRPSSAMRWSISPARRLASVVGYAGSGKSAMLGVARDEWEGEGYNVRGAALSGIAAENLEGGSGITSRTIASLEYQWKAGPRAAWPARRAGDRRGRHDRHAPDGARAVGSREAGAKVVLVGDPEQLQAIEAGAAFRSLAEPTVAAEITEIRRQREDWQRDATRRWRPGRTGEAIHAYGAWHGSRGRDARYGARRACGGLGCRALANPDKSRIILTHTNAEVRDLNLAARDRSCATAASWWRRGVKAERGAREFASGDRIMFLRNERGLG